jgi:predicted transcriptional regulator
MQEFLRDEDLQKILVAADLARPAPILDEGAEFAEFVHEILDSESAAAVVLSHDARPLGVITRAALGVMLLEWYASQQRIPPASLRSHSQRTS